LRCTDIKTIHEGNGLVRILSKFTAALGAMLGLMLVGGCANSSLPNVPAGAAAYKLIPAPVQDAPRASYIIVANDEIDIRVFQEPDLSNAKIQVDNVGNIQMPLIGEMQAGGRTTSELATEIERQLRKRYIVNPQVSVSVTKTATRSVTIEGEVKKPGVYEIDQDYTLLSAIARAESPTKTARLDEILIFRTIEGQRLAARFDLNEIRSGRSSDPRIVNGDVVIVGHSRAKGAWQDFLQAAPALNLFYLLR
jgi:polysaccharide biosynthesis/export protein